MLKSFPHDCSDPDEPKNEKLCAKFRNKEAALEFKDKFTAAISIVTDGKPGLKSSIDTEAAIALSKTVVKDINDFQVSYPSILKTCVKHTNRAKAVFPNCVFFRAA